MILTMLSYTSLERRVTMKAFGAELIVTDPTKGMGGTIQKAFDLLESTPNAFMLQQFDNPVNVQVTGNGVMDVMDAVLEVSSEDGKRVGCEGGAHGNNSTNVSVLLFSFENYVRCGSDKGREDFYVGSNGKAEVRASHMSLLDYLAIAIGRASSMRSLEVTPCCYQRRANGFSCG
ncbi:hypothetical protein NE237_024693 [Protea cynaroides]|uniref:Uncharacterized protein n=1 Tax=Protea cynaroides TaxID=273540 RepID=A0A9Q0H4Q6_9MAGN|nr:hypothetical protein NE237_024693 [Protea cynaroides]